MAQTLTAALMLRNKKVSASSQFFPRINTRILTAKQMTKMTRMTREIGMMDQGKYESQLQSTERSPLEKIVPLRCCRSLNSH